MSSLSIEQTMTCFVYSGAVMLGRCSGSGVGKYNAESPKQGSKKFNSTTKTNDFAHLVILFILSMNTHVISPLISKKSANQ